MKRGENILGKWCLSRKAISITISIAIRKGKGTGIPIRALATADPLTIWLQLYEASIWKRPLHCVHWLPAQTAQWGREEQSSEMQNPLAFWLPDGHEAMQVKE